MSVVAEKTAEFYNDLRLDKDFGSIIRIKRRNIPEKFFLMEGETTTWIYSQ